MTKKLVIVESPAKARTINRYLGPGFLVRASMGHVRDLPEKRLGVDIEKGFKCDYVTLKDRERNLRELREAAKGVSDIYLAPDPDREGEAIAWHLMTALQGAVPPDRFHRITYHEITESAIHRALERVHGLDMNMVNSQQARRVLDRIVGYKVSPLLWKRVRGASSAGRVQSAALRLVCDREKAILGFTPEEFWILGARVSKQVEPRDPFVVRLARINDAKPDVRTREQAEAVRADLDDRPMRVTSIARRETARRPPPPYITSTLQQAGSRACGFTPSRTMRLAQTLYEGVDLGRGPEGLITYMRTDSVAVAAEAQAAARRFIVERFGEAFVPERPHAFRSRESAQEAHEAIRPTDMGRTPESLAGHLKPDELRLYRLIWQRFVASQMAAAVIAQRLVEVEAVPPSPSAARYLFRASASEVVFPGYLKVAGADAAPKAEAAAGAEGEAEEVEKLPALEEGEGLDRHEWLADQKFTQPPPRYSDASLVRAMEEHGIGRPSTYSATVQVLYDRKYVEREKKTLRPTDLGMRANDFLAEHLGELFAVQFTARMEEKLDEVEKGTVEWTGMLSDFYLRFADWMKTARGPAAKPAETQRLLALLSQVREWPPGHRRGKREYGDRAFYESVARQAADGKVLSERQAQALKRLAWQYREQVPAIAAEAAALGLEAAAAAGGGGERRAAAGPPSDATLERIRLFANVEFAPPRKARGRSYDDRAFFESLRQQAEGGRELSENQIRYLDRLLEKYAAQIPDFAAARERLGIGAAAAAAGEAPAAEAAEIHGLLDGLRAVTRWREPQTRGNRTWDDREFFGSLDRQFRERRSLSPRQLAALKKMAARYAKAAAAAPAGDPPPPAGPA